MNKQFLGVAKYLECDCDVLISFINNRPNIKLYDHKDGLLMATATIDIQGIKLAADEIMIRDYDEYKGIIQALAKANIIEPTNQTVPHGSKEVQVCKLLAA